MQLACCIVTDTHTVCHCLPCNYRHTIAQRCINDNSLSQWRRAKFDTHTIEIPEPIEKKFGTAD